MAHAPEKGIKASTLEDNRFQRIRRRIATERKHLS
jgi:hypothetical protein